MDFISKLERKIGRFKIPNLTIYIIISYIIGYLLQGFMPGIVRYLQLEPMLILRGQVWRLFSWVLIPPESLSLFVIIMLFLYYNLGTTLEQVWGSFRYTLFICSGLIFTIIGAFILYLIYPNIPIGHNFSTFYVNMGIFLAFAVMFPNAVVNLFFVFPLKIKWLGYLYGIELLYKAITGNWVVRIIIIASLLNVIIFYLGTRNFHRLNPKEVRRRQQYAKEVKRPQSGPVHKCAICGRTENDGEHLEFRYCSKCDGNYEYCQDHLFTHEHVRK